MTDSPPSARERLDESWEDRQILLRVAAGDATALGYLYDRHGRTLYSVACRMLGNPSDSSDWISAGMWRKAALIAPRWKNALTRNRATPGIP